MSSRFIAKIAIGVGIFGPAVFILGWNVHAGLWKEEPLELIPMIMLSLLLVYGVGYSVYHNVRHKKDAGG
ncbi:MAG: hypothetical protein HQ488_04475 [Parcubacteria group bacterium]|nr:hypothetical protein [Parcubacteria group bacterium]